MLNYVDAIREVSVNGPDSFKASRKHLSDP